MKLVAIATLAALATAGIALASGPESFPCFQEEVVLEEEGVYVASWRRPGSLFVKAGEASVLWPNAFFRPNAFPGYFAVYQETNAIDGLQTTTECGAADTELVVFCCFGQPQFSIQ